MSKDENTTRKNGILFLQEENGEPFMPEEIGRCGLVYGEDEVTRPDDFAKNYIPFTCFAEVEYIKDGLYFRRFYKRGEWRTHVSSPLFKVWEALK